MTIIAGLLIAALIVQQVVHRNTVKMLLGKHEAEQVRADKAIRSLADRIQHPELRQVESLPPENHEPPKDAAWMALVGRITDDPLPEED